MEKTTTDDAYKIMFERRWRAIFPARLSGLFALYESLCTAAIIGCEAGSILIDVYNATIYIGLWASIFFNIAWILQTIGASCRRTLTFAKYVLIFQCIALFFTLCVIGFNAYFLTNPSTCFFPTTLCNSTAPTRGPFYSEENVNSVKIPLLRGEIATAVVMFAFCVGYIIIYVVTWVSVENHLRPMFKPPTPILTHRFSMNKSVWHIDDVTPNNSSMPVVNLNHSNAVDSTFASSYMKSFNRSRWSADSLDINPIDI